MKFFIKNNKKMTCKLPPKNLLKENALAPQDEDEGGAFMFCPSGSVRESKPKK